MDLQGYRVWRTQRVGGAKVPRLGLLALGHVTPVEQSEERETVNK
jgi:hypothetical protein